MLLPKLFLLYFLAASILDNSFDNSTSDLNSSASDINENSISDESENEEVNLDESEAFPSHKFEKRVHVQKTGKYWLL